MWPLRRRARLPRSARNVAADDGLIGLIDRELARAASGSGSTILIVRSRDLDVVRAAAVCWARTHRRRFPGGVFYLEVARFLVPHGHDVRSMVTVLLRALGVRRRSVPCDYSAAVSMYRHRTATLSTLIVVDGAVEPAVVRALVPNAAGSVVLATSRHGLSSLVVDSARFIDYGGAGAQPS